MPKARPTERKRLKDRIVESISRAVKQIQRLQHGAGEEVVLTNTDWQFHKLVEHLDHALMHGLRHITNGYWVVVQEFTPKATIKDIKIMQNITTNLGKGRAWLYLALMDHLLESYIKCYIDDHTRVARFYLKDALMLDKQQVQVIHTLVSGLEYITFNLEVDIAYLDLSSHEHVRANSSCDEDYESEDKISLASTSSTMSLNTTPEVAIDAISFQSEGGESCQRLHVSVSTPVFSQNVQGRPSPARNSVDTTIENNDGLEVIRHKIKLHTKGKKKKATDKRKIDNESLNSLDTDMASICSHSSSQQSRDSPLTMPPHHNNQDSPLTPESGYRSVCTDNNSPKCKIFEEKPNSENSTEAGLEKETDVAYSKVSTEKAADSCEPVCDSDINQNKKYNASDNLNGKNSKNDKRDICDDVNETNMIGSSQITCNTLLVNKSQSHQTSVQSSHLNSVSFTNESLFEVNAIYVGKQDTSHDLIHEKKLENEDVYNLTENVISDNGSENTFYSAESDSTCVKDEIDNSNSENIQTCKAHNTIASVSHTTSSDKKPTINNQPTVVQDWEIKVDNNMKLYLMLDVFLSEEEMLIKMFRTCLGHTEGEIKPIYLVITDCALYITTPGRSRNCRFHREDVITFKELDYISLSLGDQVINVVCTNRRKQFWITTGEEILTKCIVGHLDNAIRHSMVDLPRLSILTDATIQKIAIKKWAASECMSQKVEFKIMNYSLVYWEDADTSTSSWLHITATKSGTLHYKSHNSYFGFGGAVWKKAYCILLDGALYLYNDQNDCLNNIAAFSCLQLNHEECQGCRTSRTNERENCFEIILKDGSTLQLSADDLTECHQWLQSLCQVVAQEMGSARTSEGCLACCSVLTSTRLLLCHEDVQTNFLRTLGAANVIDISAVYIDKGSNRYCVLKFNSPSHADHQKWILYFNSSLARQNFVENLDLAWKSLFKVNLTVTEVPDLAVRKHCRENLKLIRQQRFI